MRTLRSARSVALGALIVLGLAASACSGARPELVEPVVENGTTLVTTIPLPERASCTTASGPGPVPVVVVPETVPCVVVAAHHHLELGNQRPEPIEVGLGTTVVPVAAGLSQLTEPAGTLLAPGPNRLLIGPATAAVVWLVDPTEDPLAGTAIGLSAIGDIELGFEPAQVTAATGGIPVAAAGTPCHVATLDGDPYSPLFTFRDGLLVVVQVFTPGLVTRSGVGIGSTTAEVTAAYGNQVETRPHPSGDPARQLLVFVPTDPENQIFRLVFDVTDDRVTTLRFGATEIVADQPGCGP